MKEKLIKLGYKEFNYSFLKDYQKYFLQKRVESKSVCDVNDKLFINIIYNDLKSIYLGSNLNNTFDIELMAEKNNQWYNLKCYGVNENELLDNLKRIEQNLINAFNVII